MNRRRDTTVPLTGDPGSQAACTGRGADGWCFATGCPRHQPFVYAAWLGHHAVDYSTGFGRRIPVQVKP